MLIDEMAIKDAQAVTVAIKAQGRSATRATDLRSVNLKHPFTHPTGLGTIVFPAVCR